MNNKLVLVPKQTKFATANANLSEYAVCSPTAILHAAITLAVALVQSVCFKKAKNPQIQTIMPLIEQSEMPLSDEPDIQLIDAVKNGQKDAFDTLVMRHQKWVLITALKLTGNEAMAQDAAQESFINLYISIQKSKYKEQGSFRAFLCTIVVNNCRQFHKKKKKENETIETLRFQPQGDEGVCIETKKVKKQDFENALNKLPEKQREAVVLRFASELKYSEIAASLGIAEGTAKSRVSKGLLKLRIIFDRGQK